MDYKVHAGATYEITTLALANEPGYGVELADLTATGGILAEARVRGDIITLVYQEPMPAEIYAWWAAALVELARSKREAELDESRST
jgi:hypothetical protein